MPSLGIFPESTVRVRGCRLFHKRPDLHERQVLRLQILDRQDLEQVSITVERLPSFAPDRFVNKPVGCVKPDRPSLWYLGHAVLRLRRRDQRNLLSKDRDELDMVKDVSPR